MGSSCKQVCGDGVGWSHTLMEAPTLENSKNKPVKRKSQSQSQPHQLERLKCPRCDSNDTKFCYYNNYNKSQPRHFCKSCKRHWTRGGTLRDVPVGGSRKNKRLKTSTAATATEDKERVDQRTDEARMSPSLGNDQKGISQVLQCELINEMFKNSFPFMSQNQRLQAQIQSPVRFDSGPCSISSPFRASAAYNHNGGSEKAAYSISNQPWSWEVPSSSGLVEWSHWKLDDDADPLASVDFNLPWEDSEGIKS